MKLIVTGATGFVGSEIIRLSLKLPDITTVIALSRKPVTTPEQPEEGADISKLRNVIVKDYDNYPDSVKEEFAGADACIWTVAVTPTKARAMAFEEVKRISEEWAVTGLNTMHNSAVNRPFRFIYMSGNICERDQTKVPSFMPKYLLMRGQAENRLLAIAAESKGAVEVCVAKPAMINDGATFTTKSIVSFMIKVATFKPCITVTECAAAMLGQTMDGFEKEPLENEDLIRIGQRVLSAI